MAASPWLSCLSISHLSHLNDGYSDDETRKGLANLILEARAARARGAAAHQGAPKAAAAAAAAQQAGGTGKELSDAEAAHALPPVVPRLLDCVQSSADDDLRCWALAALNALMVDPRLRDADAAAVRPVLVDTLLAYGDVAFGDQEVCNPPFVSFVFVFVCPCRILSFFSRERDSGVVP